MNFTMLADLYRADTRPGTAHRDDVELRRQQGYHRETEWIEDWGTDRCSCCGGKKKNWALTWLTRTKRICLECRLENEKMRRSLIQMKRGAA